MRRIKDKRKRLKVGGVEMGLGRRLVWWWEEVTGFKGEFVNLAFVLWVLACTFTANIL